MEPESHQRSMILVSGAVLRFDKGAMWDASNKSIKMIT